MAKVVFKSNETAGKHFTKSLPIEKFTQNKICPRSHDHLINPRPRKRSGCLSIVPVSLDYGRASANVGFSIYIANNINGRVPETINLIGSLHYVPVDTQVLYCIQVDYTGSRTSIKHCAHFISYAYSDCNGVFPWPYQKNGASAFILPSPLPCWVLDLGQFQALCPCCPHGGHSSLGQFRYPWPIS